MTKAAEYSKRYRERHPDRYQAAQLKYKLRNPTKTRARTRKRNDRLAGIDHKQAEIYRESYHACHVCGSMENLNVDHDHKTGKIRGVLCNAHNQGLGYFQDSPFFLQRAINYLRQLSPSNF